MNGLDDIRIRTNDETVTESEAIAVIEWCRTWLADTYPADDAVNHSDGEYVTVAEVFRLCDGLIDGGLLFVLSDVRRMAGTETMNYLDYGIEELDLSVRAYNVLKRMGKNTIGDILSLTVCEVNDWSIKTNIGIGLPAFQQIQNAQADIRDYMEGR